MPEQPEKSDKELLDEFERYVAACEQDERTLRALLREREDKGFGSRDLLKRKLAKMEAETAELRRELEEFRAQLRKEGSDAE